MEAARGSWRAAADAAGAAAEAVGGCDAGPAPAARSVLVAALDARVRACLTAGWDAEAAAVVDGALTAAGGACPPVAAAGWAALVAHAAGDAAGAAGAAARVASLLEEGDPAASDPDAGLATAWAALRAGAVRASCGGDGGGSEDPSPSHLFGVAAAASAASRGGATPATCPTGPVARGEAAASFGAGLAQLALRAKDWPGAEDRAAAALDDLQAASSAAAATAAPILLLGDTFARRAQLTVAEGLYKRAAQGAGLVEPTGDAGERVWAGKPGRSASALPAVHPSLAAAAAWRLAQLMTLAPRRSTEAGRWAGAAVRAGGLGPDEAALTAALGPLDGLKGGVVAGMGAPCWVDVATRRVLPRLVGVD